MKTPLIRPARIVMAAAGLLLIAAAWWQITAPSRDLVVRHERLPGHAGLPISWVAFREQPREQTDDMPGVLIAHGFGSSRRIMLGYAYTLAYAGYGVALWDFGGHGANPNPLDDTRDVLQRDIDSALDYLRSQPGVDTGSIAIVGHSMGSGAAMQAGIRLADAFRAVVAISPTGAPVTDTEPRNLLLQAGSWEQRFLDNATDLLEEAGGARTSPGAFADGNARALVEVPAAEHITILFREPSQNALLAWLDATFDRQPSSWEYVDRRALWYAVHAAGWVLVAAALAPFLRRLVPPGAQRGPDGVPALRARWWGGAMVAGPFVATGLLAALAVLVDLREIGGMLVGGAVAIWFAIYGMIWLAVGTRPQRPTARSLVLGLGLFLYLWVAFGLMTQHLALEWMLIPFRLIRWPAAALLSLPWLLAAGLGQSRAPLRLRVGMYLGQTLSIVAALALAGTTISGLYIVVLLLPALPVVFLAMATTGPVLDDPWAFAVGNALFFGWTLVSVFPLS